MSGPAEVRSIAAVESFSGQLANYRSRTSDALDGLQTQMRRLVEWLAHDRPGYWKRQTRLADTALQEARHRLQHCLMTPFVAGERPACQEEKDEVKAAERRLAYCREKRVVAKKWHETIEHELAEYQGRIGVLRQMLDGDLVRAQHALNQIIVRLRRYAIEQPLPANRSASDDRQGPAAQPSSTDSAKRKEP